MHNHNVYSRYKVLDTANIFGPLWDQVNSVAIKRWKAPLEDIRLSLDENPDSEFIQTVANIFKTFGLVMFKPIDETSMPPYFAKEMARRPRLKHQFSNNGITNLSRTDSVTVWFLDMATSVVWCGSEQPAQVYELAMSGRWAQL
jgi:hypothetical protein